MSSYDTFYMMKYDGRNTLLILVRAVVFGDRISVRRGAKDIDTVTPDYKLN
jgi:hypothetical protein